MSEKPESEHHLVLLGLALATIGAFTSGLGMNLMKASARFEKDLPWYRRPKLIVGMSLASFINTSLDCVAFALTPLSLIAPLGGVTIVASVFFARMGVGHSGEREYVSAAQWMAIFLVVGGVGVVDSFGPHPDPVLNTTQVLDHFHQTPWALYELVTAVAVLATYGGLFLGRLGGENLATVISAAVTAGLCSGVTQSMMKVMATTAGAWWVSGTLPFGYSEFWTALVSLVTVAAILMHLLNLCLSSANLTLATPLYQVCTLVCTITASCAFYGELDDVSPIERFLFGLGVLSVLSGLGVLVLTREQRREAGEAKTLLSARDAAHKGYS